MKLTIPAARTARDEALKVLRTESYRKREPIEKEMHERFRVVDARFKAMVSQECDAIRAEYADQFAAISKEERETREAIEDKYAEIVRATLKDGHA